MAQQIEHALFFNVGQGIKVYSSIIWKLHYESRIQTALQLQENIQKYISQFTEKEERNYILLRAILLNDMGNAKEAENLLLQLLLGVSDQNEKAAIYNALAPCEVRLGKIQQALEYQTACLEIYRKEDRREFIPDIANHIGSIYEQIGDYQKSEEYYQEAFKIEIQRRKKRHSLMAKTLENLSRAYCHQGLFTEAQSYIDHALTLWNRIPQESQIARGEITQGVILRDQGKYNESIQYIRSAIKRLHEPDDHQKIIKAFFHLGWTRWFQAEEIDDRQSKKKLYNKLLRSSRDYFEHSLELAEKYHWNAEVPGILHQMSNVYHLLGQRKKAIETNNRAYELSKEFYDIRYAVDSLVGKAEFDYDNGEYEHISDYAKELYDKYEEKGYRFPRFYGRMRRIVADIAFEHGDYSSALKNYIAGIAQIRLHTGYAMYSVDTELEKLEKKLDQLPLDTAIEWGIQIREDWAQRQPAEKYKLMVSWCDQQIVKFQLKSLSDEA